MKSNLISMKLFFIDIFFFNLINWMSLFKVKILSNVADFWGNVGKTKKKKKEYSFYQLA